VASLNEVSQLSELTLLPLSLDESTTDPGALDRRVCDAVCLKVARSGGITGMLESARRARASGYEVYLASSLDGPLGIAAALHAAAVIAPDRPSGLATLLQFADRDDPLPRPRRTDRAARRARARRRAAAVVRPRRLI